MIEIIFDSLTATNSDLLAKCKIEKFQASGAGGQKRNKTQTAVRIKHKKLNVYIECSNYREYKKNLDVGLVRLRLKLALIICNLSIEEFENQIKNFKLPLNMFRKNASTDHNDYAISIFLGINLFRLNQYSYANSAKKLSISTSSFIKFLKKDKLVFQEFQKLISKYTNNHTFSSNHTKSRTNTNVFS